MWDLIKIYGPICLAFGFFLGVFGSYYWSQFAIRRSQQTMLKATAAYREHNIPEYTRLAKRAMRWNRWSGK